MDLGSLIVTLGVNAYELQVAQSKYTAFTKQVERDTKHMSKTLDTLSQRFRSVGRDLSLYLTAPLALAGRQVFNYFKDYEVSLAKIIGLTGTSAEQTKLWDKEIRGLSKDVAMYPSKLAEAQYFIASSGIEASKSFGVLHASAIAAAAGLGEVNQIADLVTSAMNAYKNEGLSAANITDILVAAVREGKHEADQLAGSIGYVIPLASTLGVTFDQVAGAMAAMSETGIVATTAATNMRQMLADFLKPAHESEQTMMELGFSADYLRKALKEKGLLATLNFLNKSIIDYNKNAKGLTISLAQIFPEVRGLTGVLSLVGENFEHNREIMAATANSVGDTQEAFEAMKDTLAFKYKQSIVDVQLSMLELGEAMKKALIPILESFSERVEHLTEWFGNLNDEQQQWVLRIAAILALLGPAALLLGTLLRTVKMLVGAFAALRKFAAISKMAIAAQPYLAAALGIAALISYIRKIQSASSPAIKSLKELNAEAEKLAQYKAFSNAKKAIEENYKIIDTLNERQLISTRDFIVEQINLIEDQVAEEKRIREREKKEQEEWIRYLERFPGGTREGFKKYLSDMEKFAAAVPKLMNETMADTINYQELSYGEQLKRLQEYLTKFNEAIKNFKGEEFTFEGKVYPKEQAKAIKEYLDGLKFIEKMHKLLGDSYDYAEEKSSHFRSSLESFVKVALPDADRYMKEVTKGIHEFGSSAYKAQRIMRDLEQEVTFLSMKSMILGKSFDTDILNAYEKGLDDLIRKANDASEAINYLKTIITNLQESISEEAQMKALSNIAWQESLLGDSFDEVSAKIQLNIGTLQVLREEYDKNIDKIKQLENETRNLLEVQKEQELMSSLQQTAIQSFSQATAQAFADMGRAMVEGEEAWKSLVEVVLQSALQLMQTLLAETIAYSILHGVMKGGLIGGLIAGTVGLSILLAVWKKSTSAAKGVGMIRGGEIPPGYPNDSYGPVYLTSGERVTPPKSLDNIERDSQDIYLIGELEAAYDKLYFRIKRAEKKLENRGVKI